MSDPEERAAYDGMVGLSLNAVNPFNDKTQAADQVISLSPSNQLHRPAESSMLLAGAVFRSSA